MKPANGSVKGDGLDLDAGFVHKVRPAAGLARVETAAPNSVFALGGGASANAVQPEARSTTAPARAPQRRDRAIETLQACGPLTLEQFRQAMEISSRQATSLLSNLKKDGKVVTVRKPGALNRFAVADQSSVPVVHASKSWRPGARKVREVAPVVADPELACAFYNTGELVLEAPGKLALRLSPRQAQDIIQYLQRCAAAAAGA